jgi:hypothetical protein
LPSAPGRPRRERSASGRRSFVGRGRAAVHAGDAGLIKELGLSRSQILDGDMRDRLAFHLLKRRGYEAFIACKITGTEFGKRMGQEWASFPVLAPTKGAHRDLTRGQSYYEGR